MPSIDAVRFDTGSWEPAATDRHSRNWRNEFGDELVLLVENGPPGFPPTGDARPTVLS